MNIEKTFTFWIICIEHVEWVYVKLKTWPSSSSQRITGSCKGPWVSFSNNRNLAQRYLGLPYFILWIKVCNIVLINKSRTAWPPKMLILIYELLRKFASGCLYHFSNSVDNLEITHKICSILVWGAIPLKSCQCCMLIHNSSIPILLLSDARLIYA